MDLGAVKVGSQKQNSVLPLIWGTFRRQNGCVTQNVFLHYSWLLLACMIKRRHQRKYRGLLKPPPPVSCYFMVQSCYSGTNPNFNLWSWRINPQRHITGGDVKQSVTKSFEKWKLTTGSTPPPPLLYASLLFISEAGNRSHRISDVTELSNRQLKMVQFTSSTTWCKWPSPWHAHRRQTSC